MICTTTYAVKNFWRTSADGCGSTPAISGAILTRITTGTCEAHRHYRMPEALWSDNIRARGRFMEGWLAAWGIWLGGQKLEDSFVLWGHTIIWWNRFGQILQLFAALIVISEIIGQNNLRLFGVKYLNESISYKFAKRTHENKIIEGIKMWILIIISLFNIYNAEIEGNRVVDFFYSLNDENTSKIFSENPYEILINCFYVMTIFLFTVWIYLIPIDYLFYLLFLIITSTRNGNIIKIIGLLLALAGFHFTLLSS